MARPICRRSRPRAFNGDGGAFQGVSGSPSRYGARDPGILGLRSQEHQQQTKQRKGETKIVPHKQLFYGSFSRKKLIGWDEFELVYRLAGGACPQDKRSRGDGYDPEVIGRYVRYTYKAIRYVA
jgi:hypothetical protein